MKTGRFILLAALLGTNFITTNVLATDLIDVYEQALANDPEFKSARSKWLAEKENIAISRSALLPQLAANGSLTRNRSTSAFTNLDSRFYNNEAGYSLQLTQSIFDFGSLAKLWGAKANAKSAHATFLSAEENLLFRTSQAYFKVLLAKDTLSYTKTDREAKQRLFVQAQHKYDVGLISVTDLEEAKTQYYLAKAEEIKYNNNLDDSFEQLSEITKTRYSSLDPLKNEIPLLSPNPNSIEKWAKAAQEQNFDLLAARFATIAARENIKLQNAGHLPTIALQGRYSFQHDDNFQGFHDSKQSTNASGSVQLSIPLFQGGRVVASARQASHIYQERSAIQEKTHRAVVSQTRQNYLGVLSSISKIKADKQAIKSAKSSLRAIKASYTAKIRTMSDILTAQTELYKVQKIYAEDEHNYIIQLLNLKKLTGTLSLSELEQINSWIKKPGQKSKTKKVVSKRSSAKKTGLRKKRSKKQMTPKKDNSKITVLSAEEVRAINKQLN